MKSAKITSTDQTDDTTDRVSQHYAVGVSQHVHSQIKHPDDPIARQYMPRLDELVITPEEHPDPIGDHAHTPVKGIVHRYPDRALYKITNICPVYCRYCFRKTMVGPGQDTLKKSERTAAINYIKNTPNLREIIFTGGDPLMLSAKQIRESLNQIEAIPHIDIMRIHTRTPIADPDKITDKMTQALTRDKALYIVLHINHADELTPEVIAAIKRLDQTGAVLLSQSVLLKKINDDAQILENLFRKLVALKVKPYYLHHPDLAPGTSHFRLPIETGQNIMRDLQGRLSGLCLPTYMLDIPGGYGKIPLTQSYIEKVDNAAYHVTDYQGCTHAYPPQGKGT